jgi:pimeloyl-ACP methyl ester carboxylesterase
VPEQTARVGELELAYETFGDPADPTVLLVMGLGTQMIAWHEDFCGELVGHGLHVVRFDNRDCGRSTKLSAAGSPSLRDIALRPRRSAPYKLDDMAGDAAGLLDHLGVERAHVVGASLGGMIAQALAIGNPERLLSLVSIMSTTGSRLVGRPRLGLYGLLLRRPPRDRDRFIDQMAKVFETIGSPGFERDEGELRRMAARSFDRGHHPAGTARQLAAVAASGDRTKALRRLEVPTLVIHGEEDPLVRPSGGRATARAVPGAKLMMIAGMGHDLPRGAWPRVVEGIVATAARAGDGPARDVGRGSRSAA